MFGIVLKKIKKWVIFSYIALFVIIISSTIWAFPSKAHVRDLSLINVVVEQNAARVNLTVSTQLLAFADEDKDSQLSSQEIRNNSGRIQEFVQSRLRLANEKDEQGVIIVAPDRNTSSTSNKLNSNSHSNISLKYTWAEPITQINLEYNLFDKVYNTHCLTTIFNNGEIKNYTLTPNHKHLEIEVKRGMLPFSTMGGLISLGVAFGWGAFHALSPGHGKTLVGAYLVGSRAKPKHALFLGVTTTITHTLGVFVLGIGALVASHYILPIRLYPWLSLISGAMILIIGINLFLGRLSFQWGKISPHHNHEHSHEHSHGHSHGHSHKHTTN